jgi:hypothetical protein
MRRLCEYSVEVEPSDKWTQGPPRIGEIIGMRPAGDEVTDISGDKTEIRLNLPREIGDLIMKFLAVYFPSTLPNGRRVRSDYRYNCHTFTAAVSGWITVGAYDPNLCGWGAADLTERDFRMPVSPRHIISGNAYGLVSSLRPDHLIHSFIGVDADKHIAITGNYGLPVVANTTEVVRSYNSLNRGFVELMMLSYRGLAVIGSDHWRDVAQNNSPAYYEHVLGNFDVA